jgi:methyl-accepting chemotaxis protein
MKLETRIMWAAAGAVALATLSSIGIVYHLSKNARVDSLHGQMSSIISQSEFVASAMDDMHESHVFDMAGLLKTAVAKSKATGQPIRDIYRSSDLYKTVPIVAAWNSVRSAAAKNNYSFTVPSAPGIPARNPQNTNGAEFAAAFTAFAHGEPEYFFQDRAHDKLILARPVRLNDSCLGCHGDPALSATGDGRDVLGFPMENMKAGDIKGAFVLTANIGHDPVVIATMNKMAVGGTVVLVIVLVAFYFFNQRSVVKPLNATIAKLEEATNQMASAAADISSGSQAIADGAGEQAASLEQTSASLEELSSMTAQNAASAGQLNELAAHTREAADRGVNDMEAMTTATTAISESNSEIAKIIRTIDEIAFQTNILALNAAVEAARAGDAGMGFAVVADEVRTLAQRSADAAKETSARIEGAITRTKAGVELSGTVGVALKKIVAEARQVDELAQHVARASQEQSLGLSQLNSAVSQMDRVTQSNAAASEQSAAAARSLNEQAAAMRETMGELSRLMGNSAGPETTAPAAPVARPKKVSKLISPLPVKTAPASARRLVWDEATMATGVSSVDDQHQQLIQMLASLDEACRRGEAKSRLEEMVNFLADYAVRHFQHEEGIMDETQCPNSAKNKLAHKQFLAQFAKFKERFDKEGATTSLILELKNMTSAWLVNHICKVDTGLRQCGRNCATTAHLN